jgi:hypothetical protein
VSVELPVTARVLLSAVALVTSKDPERRFGRARERPERVQPVTPSACKRRVACDVEGALERSGAGDIQGLERSKSLSAPVRGAARHTQCARVSSDVEGALSAVALVTPMTSNVAFSIP